MNKEDLLSTVTNFYLSKRDFNGYPIHSLLDLLHPEKPTNSKSPIIRFISPEEVVEKLGKCRTEVQDLLVPLVEKDLLTIVFGDLHPNPHIKSFQEELKEIVLQKINTDSLAHACLYPTSKHLTEVVDKAKYSKRTFTLELALGAGQLQFSTFDLTVLEWYRNDPRYFYEADDISGRICITSEFCESGEMDDSDKILLESFGFAYNDDYDRAVAVFNRYLIRLSPEHQQLWYLKKTKEIFKLHPDYYRTSILGEWQKGTSIFTAFLFEQKTINEICEKINRPHLFENSYYNERRPREFSFLLRPTAKEYQDFALLLDKMMSDNINRAFFMDEVPKEEDQPRKDGKIVVIQISTIRMLETWLNKFFVPEDPKLIQGIIDKFKTIRKERQPVAHKIDDNVFDQEYFHKQRKLIISAYEAINVLRILLSTHPKVAGYTPSSTIEKPIWTQ